ncbi:MAG: hypothetical protein KBS76_08075 [Ruminococcus sp.]|nr:hypothetical protein [Candidatus Apopatosoma intestinale]
MRFKKFLKGAVTEKAPEIWDKIEAEAAASLPPRREKPRFSLWRSPAALVLSLVLLVGILVAVPTLSRLFSDGPIETSGTSGSIDDPVQEVSSSPLIEASEPTGWATESTTVAHSTATSTIETTNTTTVQSTASTFGTTATTTEQSIDTTVEWTWATEQTTCVPPTPPTFEDFSMTEPFRTMLPSAFPDGYEIVDFSWNDGVSDTVFLRLISGQSSMTFAFIPGSSTATPPADTVSENSFPMTPLADGRNATDIFIRFPSYSMKFAYAGTDLSPADLAAMIRSAPYFS